MQKCSLLFYGRTSTSLQLLTAGFEMATPDQGVIAFIQDQIIELHNLHGRYGGDEGKSAGPLEQLLYGFSSIDACEQSPILRCPTPIHIEPIDLTRIANCNAFNRALSRGRTQNISIVRPDRQILENSLLITKTSAHLFSLSGKQMALTQ